MKFNHALPIFLYGLSVVSAASLSAPLVPLKANHSPAKIINGIESIKGAQPYMTALIYSNGDAYQGQFCGGSYIGEKYILTAAHCVEDLLPSQMDVLIGVDDLVSEEAEHNRVGVRYIFSHEDFDTFSMKNDIAILELEVVPDTQAIAVGAVDDIAPLSAGDMLTVKGWGNQEADSEETPIFPTTLYEVELPYVDDETCRNAQDAYQSIGAEEICAGYPAGGYDSCQGDSGGPLISTQSGNEVVVGVVSWGIGCAQERGYSVYSDVSHYSTWLEKVTSDLRYAPFDYLGYALPGRYEHTFEVRNEGMQPVQFETATFDFLHVGNVNVTSDSCSWSANGGQAVAANSTCEVAIEFDVNRGGEASVKLNFMTDHLIVNEFSSDMRIDVLVPASQSLIVHADSNIQSWYRHEYEWLMQAAYTTVGGTALRAAHIPDESSSLLVTDELGAGVISFDYLVSSEEEYDFFDVIVNGEVVLSQSGEMESFDSFELDLTESSNLIVFVYRKDESVAEGDDTVYLDNIRFLADGSSDNSGDDGATTPDSTDNSSSDSSDSEASQSNGTVSGPTNSTASSGGFGRSGGGSLGVFSLALLGFWSGIRKKASIRR